MIKYDIVNKKVYYIHSDKFWKILSTCTYLIFLFVIKWSTCILWIVYKNNDDLLLWWTEKIIVNHKTFIVLVLSILNKNDIITSSLNQLIFLRQIV